MRHSFEILDPLIQLLEEEASGLPINSEECRNLALQLELMCPEIAGSLNQIVSRMTHMEGVSLQLEKSCAREQL